MIDKLNKNSVPEILYKVFASLGQKLSAAKTPKEAANSLLEVASELFGWDACYLTKYMPYEDTVTEIIVMDLIDGTKKEIPARFLVGKPGNMFRHVYEKGAMLLLRTEEEMRSPVSPLVGFGDRAKKSASLMFVPIRKGENCVGMLSIQSYKLNAYTHQDLELLQIIADFGSSALERTFAETQLEDLQRDYNLLKNMMFADKLEHPETFKPIITNNSVMKSIFIYIERIAKTFKPVLITGETGVGKELIAQAIHQISERKGKIVSINIAGLDDAVFSDALFGHRKGAFTGAHEARPGLIEEATDGTLFLDEIGDLGLVSQVKLLRLLQENEYFRLGEDKPRKTNARVIVSTNQDLHELMKSGKFRTDLYFRLQVHHISIPPLRKRIDDLPILMEHFLTKASESLGRKKPTIPKELTDHLASYSFPGNIRELESMVFDAVSSHKSGVLSMKTFENHIRKYKPEQYSNEPGEPTDMLFPEPLPTIKSLTDSLIAEALKRANGNQNIAARLLGISPPALCNRLKRLNKKRK